jgi:hypothetical protein
MIVRERGYDDYEFQSPFDHIRPQDGVVVKEIKGEEGVYGSIKEGKGYAKKERMTMQDYRGIRNQSICS